MFAQHEATEIESVFRPKSIQKEIHNLISHFDTTNNKQSPK